MMYRFNNEVGYVKTVNITEEIIRYKRKNTNQAWLLNEKTRLEYKIRCCKRQLAGNAEMPNCRNNDLQKFIQKCEKQLRQIEADLANHNYGKRNAIVSRPKKQDLSVLECKVLKAIAEIRKNPEIHYITKENMAKQLHAKESQIEQVFHILNRKGILMQPIHHAPHDSNRDPHGFAGGSEWMSDLYYFAN